MRRFHSSFSFDYNGISRRHLVSFVLLSPLRHHDDTRKPFWLCFGARDHGNADFLRKGGWSHYHGGLKLEMRPYQFWKVCAHHNFDDTLEDPQTRYKQPNVPSIRKTALAILLSRTFVYHAYLPKIHDVYIHVHAVIITKYTPLFSIDSFDRYCQTVNDFGLLMIMNKFQ